MITIIILVLLLAVMVCALILVIKLENLLVSLNEILHDYAPRPRAIITPRKPFKVL